MNRIHQCPLQALDPEKSCVFYNEQLGMTRFDSSERDRQGSERLLGYDPAQCCIALRPGARRPARPGAADFYWKIGITLANLDAAVSFLTAQGVEVTSPRQFCDIGYMSKLLDPDGLVIELLQRGFVRNQQEAPAGHPIGAQATLAHITFRVTDLQIVRQFFENQLSMRLVSVQPVMEYGFCLYFYAWSHEVLPEKELDAVGNREWLWSRPYAMIEIQHLQQPGAKVRIVKDDASGFRGFSYRDPGGKDRGNLFVSADTMHQLTR